MGDAVREIEKLREELRNARSIIYQLLRALAINARHETRMEDQIARLSMSSVRSSVSFQILLSLALLRFRSLDYFIRGLLRSHGQERES